MIVGQVLTAVELARGARMASNKAFLAALGLGPKAIASGSVAAVPPDHALTLAAARKLARAAALAQATNQVCPGIHQGLSLLVNFQDACP